MKQSKKWWEEEPLCFECQACGNCCGGAPGFIWVTAAEKERIASHLGITVGELSKRYLERVAGRSTIKELENFDCVFLDAEKRTCRIYEVRPAQCRQYPFWPSMLDEKEIWDYYASHCKGMNRGKRYTPEMVRRKLSENIWEDL
jgi:Fe-S-cluster containining protein